MKNKLFAFLYFLFAISLSLCVVNYNTETIGAKATEDQYSYIGDMFTYSHVETTTKVYVSGTLLQYVYEAGRTVYIEPFDPFIPVEGSNIINDENYLEENDCSNNRNPFDRHYYYATTTKPRITGKHSMYNNVESVIYALQQLEADAEYYGDNSPKNAVLGYIRTINVNYSSTSTTYSDWDVIAGGSHTSFIYQMNMLTVGGLELNEFFASFIGASSYNSSRHKTCRQAYLNNNFKLIAGPSSNCVEIDLIHMFATIDGTANGTEALISANFTKQLSGWAGDMQTATREFATGSVPNQSFNVTDFLNDDSSSFPYTDLYADIDALNMFSILNLSTCSNISNIVETYYSSMNSGQVNRFHFFVINLVNMIYGSSNDYSASFVAIVYNYCGLTSNGVNIIENDPIDLFKYSLLETQNGGYVPVVYRQRMASVFSDYILMMGWF